MDDNGSGWSQHDFIANMAKDCNKRNGNMCKKTEFVCKDYLCPEVKSAKDIAEVRSNFAQHAKQNKEPAQLSSNNGSTYPSEIADSIESACFPEKGEYIMPRETWLREWCRQLRTCR